MKIKDRNQKPTREKQYNESISENRQLLVLPSQDDLGPFNLIGTHCKKKYPTKIFLKKIAWRYENEAKMPTFGLFWCIIGGKIIGIYERK